MICLIKFIKRCCFRLCLCDSILEIEETKAVEHLQQQIQNLDLSTTQRRQLEAELVQLIQYLFSEQGKQPLGIKSNNTKTTSNQYV